MLPASKDCRDCASDQSQNANTVGKAAVSSGGEDLAKLQPNKGYYHAGAETAGRLPTYESKDGDDAIPPLPNVESNVSNPAFRNSYPAESASSRDDERDEQGNAYPPEDADVGMPPQYSDNDDSGDESSQPDNGMPPQYSDNHDSNDDLSLTGTPPKYSDASGSDAESLQSDVETPPRFSYNNDGGNGGGLLLTATRHAGVEGLHSMNYPQSTALSSSRSAISSPLLLATPSAPAVSPRTNSNAIALESLSTLGIAAAGIVGLVLLGGVSLLVVRRAVAWYRQRLYSARRMTNDDVELGQVSTPVDDKLLQSNDEQGDEDE